MNRQAEKLILKDQVDKDRYHNGELHIEGDKPSPRDADLLLGTEAWVKVIEIQVGGRLTCAIIARIKYSGEEMLQRRSVEERESVNLKGNCHKVERCDFKETLEGVKNDFLEVGDASCISEERHCLLKASKEKGNLDS